MASAGNGKQPWLKFYPSDWRADPALRMCSVAARGLWMEMLCLMHDATPAGSLVVNSRQVTMRQLASLAAVTVKEVEGLVEEMEEAGVFSRDDDGTIYSRRMRRDILKAEADRVNGRGGGNPKLVETPNRGVNPRPNRRSDPDKQGDNPPSGSGGEGVNPHARTSADARGIATQRPEARGQNQEQAAAGEPGPAAAVLARAKRFEPHDDGPADDYRQAEQACIAALGGSTLAGGQAPADAAFGPVMLLIDRGFPLRDVTTVLRSEAQRPRRKPIRTWALWAEILAERLAQAPPAAPAAVDPSDPIVDFRGGVTAKLSTIRMVLDRGTWLDQWGPKLGEPGCRVPDEVAAMLVPVGEVAA